MVSCQKGPTRHAYAWQIGPFWQDTLDIQYLYVYVYIYRVSPYAIVNNTNSKDEYRSLMQQHFICHCAWEIYYSDPIIKLKLESKIYMTCFDICL